MQAAAGALVQTSLLVVAGAEQRDKTPIILLSVEVAGAAVKVPEEVHLELPLPVLLYKVAMLLLVVGVAEVGDILVAGVAPQRLKSVPLLQLESAVADANMARTSVTLAVFQPARIWLKAAAD